MYGLRFLNSFWVFLLLGGLWLWYLVCGFFMYGLLRGGMVLGDMCYTTSLRVGMDIMYE